MDICEDCGLPLAECECVNDDDNDHWPDDIPWPEEDEPEKEDE